jgi:hypothetical protein
LAIRFWRPSVSGDRRITGAYDQEDKSPSVFEGEPVQKDRGLAVLLA